MVNSALIAVAKSSNELYTYTVASETITIPYFKHLSTTLFDIFFPGMSQKYGKDVPIDLKLRLANTPTCSIKKGELGLNAALAIDVILKKSEPVVAFTI